MDAEVRGSTLHDEWVDFVNTNQSRIRIPRETRR